VAIIFNENLEKHLPSQLDSLKFSQESLEIFAKAM